MTAALIGRVFSSRFSNPVLDRGHDGAMLTLPEGRIAFSTDTFVVTPLFFPGGDIGDLAVNGTVNDLLCCGAVPRYLSVGFVIEEGFPIADLERIADSMARAAVQAEVEIVTGDTKVVEKGHCDGVYINTTGIGHISPGVNMDPEGIRPGDNIIISGSVARHGMSVMSRREGLVFDSEITSDTASLCDLVRNLFDAVPDGAVRVLRDPTRGGIASTLNELAMASGVDIEIDEQSVPVQPAVRAACELLGLDPFCVANEGVIIAAVASEHTDAALAAMRRSAHGEDAALIGHARTATSDSGAVFVRLPAGNRRRLEMITGEQLPRIC